MDNPRAPHMTAAKHILRYLKGTSDFGLLFPIGNDQNRSCIEAYSDSDWCGDKVERKSTSGYLFKYLDAPISWCSKKQSVVALSSCEAEYIGSVEAACQSLWLEALLEEMKLQYERPVHMYVDNKSVISLSKNPVSHGKSKHIETKYHFLRDQSCILFVLPLIPLNMQMCT
ncbi:Copia protein, partial [Mucuna pruriens]